MKTRIPSCCAVLAAIAFAGPAPAIQSDRTLDEVTVIAERLQPWELRKMLIDLEDRFYERFNALNDRDEYDVNCIVTANTGTNLKHRECRPMFEVSAIQKQAREAFLVRQDVQHSGARATRLHGTFGMPPMAEIEAIRPHYRAHMVSLVREDEALSELLKQRAAIESALKEKRQRTALPGSDAAQ